MIHWAWLILAVLGGAFLGVAIVMCIHKVRTPPSPFSDRSIAKMEKMKGFGG